MDFQRQSLLAYLEDSGFDILDDWYPRADQDAIRAELEARVDSHRNVFGFDLEYSGVDGRVYAVVAIHNNIYQGYIYACPNGNNIIGTRITNIPALREYVAGMRGISDYLFDGVNRLASHLGYQTIAVVDPLQPIKPILKRLGFTPGGRCNGDPDSQDNSNPLHTIVNRCWTRSVSEESLVDQPILVSLYMSVRYDL